MPTKVLQLFADRSEVLHAVADLMAERGVSVAAYLDQPRRSLVDLTDPAKVLSLPADVWRIYVGERPMALEAIDPSNFNPGELGWVQISLPTANDGSLTMCDVAIKDPSEPPRSSAGLFADIAGRLKKLKVGHVIGTNVVHGGEHEYPRIPLLPGAALFASQGGTLVQRGVRNVRFRPVRH